MIQKVLGYISTALGYILRHLFLLAEFVLVTIYIPKEPFHQIAFYEMNDDFGIFTLLLGWILGLIINIAVDINLTAKRGIDPMIGFLLLVVVNLFTPVLVLFIDLIISQIDIYLRIPAKF